MCNVCCKEFHGWCRAFTATEVILSIVQALLLTIFVAFLTFLILHFFACADNKDNELSPDAFTTERSHSAAGTPTLKPSFAPTRPSAPQHGSTAPTVPPDVACTWTPSAKTAVVTQYFELAGGRANTTADSASSPPSAPVYDEDQPTSIDDEGVFGSDQFDGVPAGDERSSIMALVKVRSPDDVTFGCVLTVVSQFWTLTAASCIESVEEVDALDSFVIMENIGEAGPGRVHAVSDVLIHPQYQGTNESYDLAALKSRSKLSGGAAPLQLPTTLDYLLIAIGERLTIIGFGKFRSIDRSAAARVAHAVAVHAVGGAACGARGGAGSARHLAGGAARARGRCGAAAVCAGPLHARGAPCNYCAGTPLLQGRTLLGLMSAPGPCGAACEPALYVNLAACRDWLDSFLVEH